MDNLEKNLKEIVKKNKHKNPRKKKKISQIHKLKKLYYKKQE